MSKNYAYSFFREGPYVGAYATVEMAKQEA